MRTSPADNQRGGSATRPDSYQGIDQYLRPTHSFFSYGLIATVIPSEGRWRPDSCGNSERLFRSSSLPIPVETDNNRGPVIPVSERSFADRSGLVEIHVT